MDNKDLITTFPMPETRNIPNAVSGDGKTFVAALKNYLSKLLVATDGNVNNKINESEAKTDDKISDAESKLEDKISDTETRLDDKIDNAVSSITEKPKHVSDVGLMELHSVNDGVRNNSISASWDITQVESYAKAEVWYKTSGDWQKAGESSGTQYVLQGVEAKATYFIRVVAVNKKGNAADFDTAPTASITVKGNQYIPAAPTQFTLIWDERGPLWQWLFADNDYIDFFELRLDRNPGTWNDKRLDSTRELYSRANPDVRAGTAYLYVRNIFGEYSEPAVHQFAKAQGGKPGDPVLTSTLDGVNIKLEPLPQGYTHYRLHITSASDSTAADDYFETANSEFIYFFFVGTVSVSYCFVDGIGEGEWSDTVTANVKDLIVDESNIADGAIGEDKIKANAVTAGKIAANSIDAHHVKADAIDADKIVAGAIKAKHLSVESVGADALQANSVVGDKIAANSISGKHLSAENIDLLGALMITGGNVRLSEEGLRLTGGDGSYTLFDKEGINYVDKNGITYAQVKKMIIGKAYDGQYIRFAAPWAKPPIVLISPLAIQVNNVEYPAASMFLVCEATDISVNGFKINSYLRLASDSYHIVSEEVTDTPVNYTVEEMTKTGYGSYTYKYNFVCYSDVTQIAVPETANYIEFALQLTITKLGIKVKYPGANSGYTTFRSDTQIVTVQLVAGSEVTQEVAFSGKSADDFLGVAKNFTLSSNIPVGTTKVAVRVVWNYKLATSEHGHWETLYNGRDYIAKAICSCDLARAYYKYSSSDAKIARGYAMFLVTDGSTNTYQTETFVKVLINYDGSPLTNKAISVGGTTYITDNEGYIEMKGVGYQQYTFLYSLAVPINADVDFTDGVVSTVNIEAPNIVCYIKVTYDGVTVANQTVKINGEEKTTDENGKVEINGVDGHSGDYIVAYGNDEQTITVKYVIGGTTVAALYSLQDGSKTWTWKEANGTISFAVPTGAHKIKVEASVDHAEAEPYLEFSAGITNAANKKAWGSGYSYCNDNGENEEHEDIDSVVAVTPGKTYSLLFDCNYTSGVTFSWGREIDKLEATVTDNEE